MQNYSIFRKRQENDESLENKFINFLKNGNFAVH